MRFMGIDLGGTSTRCVVSDVDGALLGFGRAAGGNPRSSVGDPAENLATAIRTAGIFDVDAVGIGAAGTGSARRDEMLDTLRRGLSLAGVTAPTAFDTDFGIAFRSASPSPDGRLLLAGTGAVAAQYANWEMTRRFDGLGWLLGDTGSGSWIGREALRAVAADLDGRGEPTVLSGQLLDHYGIADDPDPAQALVRVTDGTRAAEWATVTPFVIGSDGDPVASRILDAAAAALTDTLSYAGDGPTVLAGGVLGAEALRRRVEARIGATEYADHPVVGAVALAAAECGATIDREALARALRNR
ncbi:N-acetylglucosamine kinase [Tessaracoccus oleiagri]|uniref:BadF-type ATPase n=1 Tax=Tessaracoccus oleiagri TaxID=686624 RepID=A0A1G9HY90_9ACTN|nr:BadF/BadG/BcrA/BcrD ATPase family protein [Tessaracoccus oleiagri]SDL17967.1 BadF-type ATPase [Tessaracoccus oleiagri]